MDSKPPSPAVYAWCDHLFTSVLHRHGLGSHLPFVFAGLPLGLALPLPGPSHEDRCPGHGCGETAPSPSAPLRGRGRGGDETEVGHRDLSPFLGWEWPKGDTLQLWVGDCEALEKLWDKHGQAPSPGHCFHSLGDTPSGKRTASFFLF